MFGQHRIFSAQASQSNLEARPVSAVPEPSTWAMMIVGFASLGFIAYRPKAEVGPNGED